VTPLRAALASLLLAAAPAGAQDALWPNAPWRAFVTGSFSGGFMPSSLAAGDLDGDGDLDVVVGQAFNGGPGLSVLANRGDGTYLPPVYYALASGNVVGDVALADFDGDGDLDALATIPGATDNLARVLVYRNAGNGALGAPSQYTTGLGPVGLVVADFTGDGKPDVATANHATSAQSVSLLKHNGLTGASAALLPATDFPTGLIVDTLAAADLTSTATAAGTSAWAGTRTAPTSPTSPSSSTPAPAVSPRRSLMKPRPARIRPRGAASRSGTSTTTATPT
jgi:hypothetical protein